jgi:hypothetical protein
VTVVNRCLFSSFYDPPFLDTFGVLVCFLSVMFLKTLRVRLFGQYLIRQSSSSLAGKPVECAALIVVPIDMHQCRAYFFRFLLLSGKAGARKYPFAGTALGC